MNLGRNIRLQDYYGMEHHEKYIKLYKQLFRYILEYGLGGEIKELEVCLEGLEELEELQ